MARVCIKSEVTFPLGNMCFCPLPSSPAYYAVSSTSSGKVEDILDNDNFDGRRYLTVADGQYLDHPALHDGAA